MKGLLCISCTGDDHPSEGKAKMSSIRCLEGFKMTRGAVQFNALNFTVFLSKSDTAFSCSQALIGKSFGSSFPGWSCVILNLNTPQFSSSPDGISTRPSRVVLPPTPVHSRGLLLTQTMRSPLGCNGDLQFAKNSSTWDKAWEPMIPSSAPGSKMACCGLVTSPANMPGKEFEIALLVCVTVKCII